jgi:hypothetical protein
MMRWHPSRPWRRLLFCGLGLLLLVAQHGALTHVFAHLASAAAGGWPPRVLERIAAAGDAGGGHVVACEKCLEYAGFGSALPVRAVLPVVSTPPDAWSMLLPVGVAAVFVAVYRSRAPPRLIRRG